tara:strand:- start:120 stop:704 length:585 start_codon:yes stop_codon:yes gene_type:complete
MGRSPRYDCITEEINKCKPSTILEIGTHMALTARIMIEAAMVHKDDVFYYGFDMFDFMTEEMAVEEHHGKRLPTLNKAAKRLAPFPHKLIMGNTQKTLPKFKPDRPIDFVFIDGGHSVETIQSDWENVERLMHDNTVVIFDDYYDDTEKVGCKTIVDSLDKKYSVEKISAPFSLASKRRALGKRDISLVKVSLK